MTDRSSTLVNASLSMQSTLGLRFLVSLKRFGSKSLDQKQCLSLPRVLQHC
jgi:hypothetical protein